MTESVKCGINGTTNPVLTVARSKEDFEMIGATEKITALYCRLSQEDERLGESLSIDNQQIMLERYAKEHRFRGPFSTLTTDTAGRALTVRASRK